MGTTAGASPRLNAAAPAARSLPVTDCREAASEGLDRARRARLRGTSTRASSLTSPRRPPGPAPPRIAQQSHSAAPGPRAAPCPEQHKRPGRGLCDLAFAGAAFGIRTRDLRTTRPVEIVTGCAIRSHQILFSLIRAPITVPLSVCRVVPSTSVRAPLALPTRGKAMSRPARALRRHHAGTAWRDRTYETIALIHRSLVHIPDVDEHSSKHSNNSGSTVPHPG